MVDRQQIGAFRKRWGITVSDKEEFAKFKNRILDALSAHLDDLRTNESFVRSYALMIGHSYATVRATLQTYSLTWFIREHVPMQTFSEVIDHTQMILWALKESDHLYIANELAVSLEVVFQLSHAVQATILPDGDSFMIYPAGAELLDEKLVEETLEWLEGYPIVRQPFHEALRMHVEKEISKYRNLLDNLRFSLEQMLRVVLNNHKSLENQTPEINKWLASHKIHAHVINMYQDLVSKFASYQNEAVKHNERYSVAEIEFMIYLTGTFLRFLVQLHTGKQIAPANLAE
jgi:hypothetical protein